MKCEEIRATKNAIHKNILKFFEVLTNRHNGLFQTGKNLQIQKPCHDVSYQSQIYGRST